MTCLHTISCSPSTNLLASCSSCLKPGDAILFIEDGIYYCTSEKEDELALDGISIYALSEDMIARGVLDRRTNKAELINYDQFVGLCCEFEKVVSWF